MSIRVEVPDCILWDASSVQRIGVRRKTEKCAPAGHESRSFKVGTK